MTTKLQMREERTRQQILQTLDRNREGLTISEISRQLGIHYTTVSKYLAVMEAQQHVMRRDIGMAKIFRMIEKGE